MPELRCHLERFAQAGERHEAIAAGIGKLLKDARKQVTRPGTSGRRRARRAKQARNDRQMSQNQAAGLRFLVGAGESV